MDREILQQPEPPMTEMDRISQKPVNSRLRANWGGDPNSRPLRGLGAA